MTWVRPGFPESKIAASPEQDKRVKGGDPSPRSALSTSRKAIKQPLSYRHNERNRQKKGCFGSGYSKTCNLLPQNAYFSRGLHNLLGAQCFGLVLGDKETILGQV
jgi:hypothetical protein